MTAPLTDERLAEILAHAPNCRYGCVACESAPDLVAEVERLGRDLAEMTGCRDAAVRLAEREDTEIEFDLDGNLRDGLAGIAEWEHPGEPDHAPDWLIDAVVRVVRPELARLTEALNAECVAHWNTRKELSGALERPTHPAFERLRRERDQANGKLAATTTTVVLLAAIRDRALALIERFADDTPCRLDHGGFCQAHGSEAPCRGAEARRVLGLDRGADDAIPDVCPDCYGRGDDFEGGACPRCHGTGAAT